MPSKKSIDIQDEIEKRQAATPVILKCSLNFHRKLKTERHRITDPQVSAMFASLTIRPVGTLPDHVILLCDAHGKTIRMINLTARPKERSAIFN